ncbi:MAG: RidA family protein [Acidobacteria bacterium]|nr:RidA family protein [Acidobacteriota bacterium]
MAFKIINPESLGRPRGYANGVLAEGGGRILFVAGQIAWDAGQRIVSDDFAEQFGRALANVLAVVAAAGGGPETVARLTVYVTDKREYLARTREIGERWRALMGAHYPAMSLVEVSALLEDGARVEIEATAVLPSAVTGDRSTVTG